MVHNPQSRSSSSFVARRTISANAEAQKEFDSAILPLTVDASRDIPQSGSLAVILENGDPASTLNEPYK